LPAVGATENGGEKTAAQGEELGRTVDQTVDPSEDILLLSAEKVSLSGQGGFLKEEAEAGTQGGGDHPGLRWRRLPINQPIFK